MEPCAICKVPTDSGDLDSFFHHGCAGYPFCICDKSHSGDCQVGTMDDKIKAKAQEVRLVLLEALGRQVKDVESSVPAEEVSASIQDLAGILNQLDPGAGIGSYASSVTPLTDEEIRSAGFYSPQPPILKPGDVVRVEGFDMVVSRISVGFEQDRIASDESRRIRVDLIPAGNAGVGGYSTK